MPYTAQEIVITGTVTTALGTEDVTLTYTLDVDHEPIRLTGLVKWDTADQINKTITGVRSDGISTDVINISRNGSRASWSQRGRYTYKIKFEGEENWSDAVSISLNSGGSAIGYITDKPFDVQVFYDYSGTHEQSPVYHIDVTSIADHLENVTFYSETEGVVIDNTARSISVTASATDNIDIYVKQDDVIVPDSNAYYSFCNKWVLSVRGSTISAHLTAADMAGVSYAMPVVVTTSGGFGAEGPVYTITVTITE